MQLMSLSDSEFQRIRSFLYREAGISLSPAKKALVSGRLTKRLRHHGLDNFGEYFKLVESGSSPAETRLAIDLLTTNETYFFREPKHFQFLRQRILPALPTGRSCRIWSAACSSGEEPYSIAMLLTEQLPGRSWELLASDISKRILARARTGHYPDERGRNIPPDFFARHCLKGIGRQEGTFLVERELRARVQFAEINLNQTLPEVGTFDVIFLRNVMIYFDADTKRQVVNRLLTKLRPAGYLFIGHSESLHGLELDLKAVQPAVYQKG